MAKYKKCVNCTESQKNADELYNGGICEKCNNYNNFLELNELKKPKTRRYDVDFGIVFLDRPKSNDKQFGD